jgi:hypothetical protein
MYAIAPSPRLAMNVFHLQSFYGEGLDKRENSSGSHDDRTFHIPISLSRLSPQIYLLLLDLSFQVKERRKKCGILRVDKGVPSITVPYAWYSYAKAEYNDAPVKMLQCLV